MMQGRDLYLQVTTNGRVQYDHRRVWDGEKFLESLRNDLTREKALADVTVITREEYLNGKQ